jgi:hypothetical protein
MVVLMDEEQAAGDESVDEIGMNFFTCCGTDFNFSFLSVTGKYFFTAKYVKSTSFASVYALVSRAAITKRHCIGRLF